MHGAMHIPLCLNLQKHTLMLNPCTLAVLDEYEKSAVKAVGTTLLIWTTRIRLV